MNDFLGVLVLYKISLQESSSFQSLLNSLKFCNFELTLFVYDNSPVDKKHPSFFKIDNISIYYKSDVHNSGLSVAYNSSSQLATKLGKRYLILLDQDSYFPIDYCRILLDSIVQFKKEKLFVPLLMENGLLLSPCRLWFLKGFVWHNRRTGVVKIKGLSVFNSGMCIDISAYKEIGGYSELIPLDFSDHYFISQYKKKYATFVVLPVKVTHSLSSFSPDKQSQLNRFRSYCLGTRYYSRFHKGYMLLLFWNFLRAIKLSVIFRDFSFMRILLNNYIAV